VLRHDERSAATRHHDEVLNAPAVWLRHGAQQPHAVSRSSAGRCMRRGDFAPAARRRSLRPLNVGESACGSLSSRKCALPLATISRSGARVSHLGRAGCGLDLRSQTAKRDMCHHTPAVRAIAGAQSRCAAGRLCLLTGARHLLTLMSHRPVAPALKRAPSLSLPRTAGIDESMRAPNTVASLKSPRV